MEGEVILMAIAVAIHFYIDITRLDCSGHSTPLELDAS